MPEFDNLTLYREKSTVHRFAELGDSEGEEQVLEIRSNRLTVPLKLADHTFNCVIRGQNMASTLRLTGFVVDQFRRDPGMVHDAKDIDWESLWVRRLSTYESTYNPATWVSIHLDGEEIFSTGEDGMEVIHEIESLAGGGDVSDSIIMEASSNVIGALDDLVVEHDSQTAFVFTAFAAYHRAAVLERKGGKTGSFAISVYHPTPKKPIRLSYFLGLSADILEALTMAEFLHRVQTMIDDDSINSTPITPSQIAAARNRKKDLMEQITSFEAAQKVTYRPERPSFN
ncbi:MAG: hypothetical protein GKS03_12010 [Alphaproteobacteria bacterium]|nr:hypothetical protein [Alphaproteobacteria bacterium]